ncbi:14339_t:CDS:1, partial [Funneliformis mosseae]
MGKLLTKPDVNKTKKPLNTNKTDMGGENFHYVEGRRFHNVQT